jgi:cytoskeletal protein CcmA (bactofilin family)
MRRKPVLCLIFTISLFFAGASGYAFIADAGEDLIIGRDEVINEDLFLAGRTIVIDGTVNGDLYAAGENITITGTIRDSAMIAGGSITITGTVGHGIKAAGRELIFNGIFGGDIVVAGDNISIGEGAEVDGDFIVAGQKVRIDGPINGYILGAGQTISVSSLVRGDATFAVKTLTLKEGARIGGDLLYLSEEEAVIFSGAEIVGSINHRIPEVREKLKAIFPFMILAGIVGKIVAFIMMVIVGLVFVLLTPRWLNRLSNSIKKQTGPCAGWGALFLFVTPIGVVIAMTTIVGIPLAVISLFIYLIAFYLSQIIVGFLIGRLILGLREEVEKKILIFSALVLGLFLIRLVRFIPVVGYIVWVLVALFGIGAIAVSEIRRIGGKIEDAGAAT